MEDANMAEEDEENDDDDKKQANHKNMSLVPVDDESDSDLSQNNLVIDTLSQKMNSSSYSVSSQPIPLSQAMSTSSQNYGKLKQFKV